MKNKIFEALKKVSNKFPKPGYRKKLQLSGDLKKRISDLLGSLTKKAVELNGPEVFQTLKDLVSEYESLRDEIDILNRKSYLVQRFLHNKIQEQNKILAAYGVFFIEASNFPAMPLRPVAMIGFKRKEYNLRLKGNLKEDPWFTDFAEYSYIQE